MVVYTVRHCCNRCMQIVVCSIETRVVLVTITRILST